MEHKDDHQHGAEATDAGVEHDHQHRTHPAPRRPDGLRRIELITGQERRRRWSAEEKAAITAESFVPGVNVAQVARRAGVSAGLLHYWRRCARDGTADDRMRFVPVLTVEPSEPSPGQVSASPCIEIEFAGARVRVVGMVDGEALRTVMVALRASA